MRLLMNKIYVSLLDGLLVFRILLYYYKITAKMLMQIYKHFFLHEMGVEDGYNFILYCF